MPLSPRVTVQFPRDILQLLELFSSSSSYCPVYIFFGFPANTIHFSNIFLHQTTHPSLSVFLFCKNRKFFSPYLGPSSKHTMTILLSSIYWPVPRAIVHFFELLSTSSSYCPLSRAICYMLMSSFLEQMYTLLPLGICARRLDILAHPSLQFS